MEQTIKHGIRHISLMVIAMMVTTFSSCSEKGSRFNFKNPQEALTACHQELSKVKPLKEAKMDKLIEITSTWLELQDSTFSCFMRDSTVKADTKIASDFFAVADTFRTEITRLAFSEKRTLPDIVKLKVNTAKDRKRILASEDFKKACEFYSKADDAPLYGSLNETLSEYEKLLTNANPFKKEKQLYDFIQREDRCFRSLLVFLKDTPQSKLQNITDKTSEIFDRLYRNTTADLENKVNERVLLYLTMRFNRRIIQNAEVCRQDIKKKLELNDMQAINYRWMIIQPFMTIDNEAMELITDQQVVTLTEMANELPQLLAYVDGKDFDKSPKEETSKLQGILSEYLLNTYLKSIL